MVVISRGSIQRRHFFRFADSRRRRDDPDHSQLHWSASSGAETRNNFLYCSDRPGLLLTNGSSFSTKRFPLRSITTTSPPAASSSKRNQFCLASDAVTF